MNTKVAILQQKTNKFSYFCALNRMIMEHKERFSIGLAILAAVFYAINIPCSKALLADTPPTMMAAFLYIGAGIGMGAMMLARKGSRLLGYVSYGLSIYVYTYAQRVIGAARTSTYYAVAPFIGSALSIIFLGEQITLLFCIALTLMAIGAWLAAKS